MTTTEVLRQCLHHFKAMDEANAAIHCANVRYSPITFRIAEALNPDGRPCLLGAPSCDACAVLEHKGAYEEDKGRRCGF